MRHQFRRVGRPVRNFRKTQPPDMLSSELRHSLQNLADSINQTVKMLERFENRSAEPDEERSEVPRAGGPLIPTRRSQLLAKIDMRPPFRRQD